MRSAGSGFCQLGLRHATISPCQRYVVTRLCGCEQILLILASVLTLCARVCMQGVDAALAILALYPGRLKPAPPLPAA